MPAETQEESSLRVVVRRLCSDGGRLIDRLVQFGLCVIVVMGGCALVAYMLQQCWMLYSHTPVGQVWIGAHERVAAQIEEVFALGLTVTAVAIPLRVVATLILIAVPLRFFWLLRFCYEPFGLVLRTLLWGGGCIWWLAGRLAAEYGLTPVSMGFVLLLPSLFLLNPSFNLVIRLLPEPSDLWQRWQEKKRRAELGF